MKLAVLAVVGMIGLCLTGLPDALAHAIILESSPRHEEWLASPKRLVLRCNSGSRNRSAPSISSARAKTVSAAPGAGCLGRHPRVRPAPARSGRLPGALEGDGRRRPRDGRRRALSVTGPEPPARGEGARPMTRTSRCRGGALAVAGSPRSPAPRRPRPHTLRSCGRRPRRAVPARCRSAWALVQRAPRTRLQHGVGVERGGRAGGHARRGGGPGRSAAALGHGGGAPVRLYTVKYRVLSVDGQIVDSRSRSR